MNTPLEWVGIAIFLSLGVAWGLHLESQNTRLRLARETANKAVQEATLAMQQRPDQRETIFPAVAALNTALLSPDKNLLGYPDAGKIAEKVELATNLLNRTVVDAKVAPRPTEPHVWTGPRATPYRESEVLGDLLGR